MSELIELTKIAIAVSAALMLSHMMIKASKPSVAPIRGTAGPNETPEEYNARMAAIWGDETEEHF